LKRNAHWGDRMGRLASGYFVAGRAITEPQLRL
jgi:hypothetical protein